MLLAKTLMEIHLSILTLTVVPIRQSDDLKDTYFAQLSLGSMEQFGDRRITTNFD